jgi:thioredoxin-dependent peroxiredoxin
MEKISSSTLKAVLLALLLLSFNQLFSQTKNEIVKVKPPQAAPTFTIKDINGTIVNLADYKGKKVMLTFYRNVGCPICNLRFNELQAQADYFKSKGLVLLAVYESTADNMKQYLEGQSTYATMIPNAEQDLYKLYDIDRSGGKMMKGMFHGAMGKMKKGKKLFKSKIKQDGNSNRIGADFLIDENGNVKMAHYGSFVGDHISLETIKQFLN